MSGFEAERQTAKAAIESLDHEPVMAELLGARPHSPKAACLDGVASADWYLALLGERYGFIAADGTSPTEQEFREAMRRGLPIAVLVQEGPKEDRQGKFIDDIGSYDEGYLYAKFGTTTELATAVTRALKNLEKHSAGASPGAGSSRLRELLHRDDRERGRYTRVDVGIVPLGGGDLLDAVTLGDETFRRTMVQEALFGPCELFDYRLGTTVEDGREHITLIQHLGHGERLNAVELHSDGAMLVSIGLRDRDSDDRAMTFFREHVIEEGAVAAAIAGAARFAAAVYSTRASRRPQRAALQASLANASGRLFGPRPRDDRGGRSYQMSSIEEPLIVPKAPSSASLAELKEATALAKGLVALFKRVFVSAGAYVGQRGG